VELVTRLWALPRLRPMPPAAGRRTPRGLVKVLTGEEPRIRRKSDGTIEIERGRRHLDGFAHYAELADAIEKWLEETGRQ
jgi:hypothetical protein